MTSVLRDCDHSAMGWLPVAAVVFPNVVAFTALVTTALTRRGDRQHASSLEFEKRLWEKKSTALLDLINLCQNIIDDIDAEPDRENAHIQFSVLRAFENADYRANTPELIAYASPAVKAVASDLQQVMTNVQRLRADMDIVTDDYTVRPLLWH